MRVKNVLVVILVILLFSASLTYAQDGEDEPMSRIGFFSDAYRHVYESSLSMLNVLGVFLGRGDGNVYPNANVTRAEFAAVVVRMLGQENTARALSATRPKFSDTDRIPSWSWGYVNTVEALGIMKGRPGGIFDANASVAFEEALAMLIRALGYEPEVTGQWPSNYILKASELKLFDGVNMVVYTPATRGQLARMVDNSVRVKRFTGISSSTGTKTYADPIVRDKTVTGRLLEVKKGEGIWTIKLEREQVSAVLTLADPVVVSGAPSVGGLLYLNVEATKNQEGKVAYLRPVEDNLTVTDGGILENLTVIKGIGELKNAIELLGGTRIIYNSGTRFARNFEHYRAATDLIRGDWLYISAVNGIAVFVRAFGAEEFNRVVSAGASAIKSGDMVTGYSLPHSAGTYLVRTTAMVTLNGVRATIGSIRPYDVISVAKSGAEVIYIEVTRNSVTGKISEFQRAASTGTITHAMINGIVYPVLPGNIFTDSDLNTTVTVNLTKDGTIAVKIK